MTSIQKMYALEAALTGWITSSEMNARDAGDARFFNYCTASIDTLKDVVELIHGLNGEVKSSTKE